MSGSITYTFCSCIKTEFTKTLWDSTDIGTYSFTSPALIDAPVLSLVVYDCFEESYKEDVCHWMTQGGPCSCDHPFPEHGEDDFSWGWKHRSTYSPYLSVVSPPAANCDPFKGKVLGPIVETVHNEDYNDDVTTKDYWYQILVIKMDGKVENGRETPHSLASATSIFKDNPSFFYYHKDTGVVAEVFRAYVLLDGYKYHHQEINIYQQVRCPLMDGSKTDYQYNISEMQKVISTDDVLGWFNINGQLGLEAAYNVNQYALPAVFAIRRIGA